MKKAKIALSVIAALGVVGSALAFKAAKRSTTTYFIGSVYNATPTATLTKAITVPQAQGEYAYYTLLSTARATNHSFVTTGN